jgi:hypothetical protein
VKDALFISNRSAATLWYLTPEEVMEARKQAKKIE